MKSGNQLQEYADSLERRLADAEVEEEATKHELSELKEQNTLVDHKYKEDKKEYIKQNNINNDKIAEYEFVIKDMNNIIAQLKNDQKSDFLDKDDFLRDSTEEKSFKFLDSIIEVSEKIFTLLWKCISAYLPVWTQILFILHLILLF